MLSMGKVTFLVECQDEAAAGKWMTVILGEGKAWKINAGI
jgi:hypothetical protein